MLEDHWGLVVGNMVRIAQGNGREAVQAARFVAQQKERIQDRDDGPKAQGPSEARRLLDKFKGTSQTVTARRRVVTEEVELSPSEGMPGVVIEG